MTFTFETLPIENKEILRQRILELFHLDIGTVSSAFSTRNYVFIFGEGCFPSIIRVGPETCYRKMEDVMSELMWMDDLKNDITNICQPIPSSENRMVERIEVGKTVYLVTMFRKANGAILSDSMWDKQHFYNAGALLGKIHRTSSEGYQRGFRYKRKHWDESSYYDFSSYDEYFAPDARADAQAVLEKIKRIPRDPRWYGMIHGDYHNGNMFCDWGDLWAFDFDDCCYGYFMFDIVCLAHICIVNRTYAETQSFTTAHDRLLAEDGGILTQIRAGYSSEYLLPEEQWALFDDFFRLRMAQIFAIQTQLKLYPRDIAIALTEPALVYLKNDKSPIDRIEEVQKNTASRLTPEQLQAIIAGVAGESET